MALIKCSSCGHMVSDKGAKCPKCGTPIIKEKKSEAASEVESFRNHISSEENTEAEMTISTGYKKKNLFKKKGVVAVVCGVLVIIAIASGFYLWQNVAREKYERQEPPVYSEELVKIAEKGNAVAQYDLGVCYANGFGVSQDYTEAVRWFRKAAEQGNADAQNSLGIRYKRGDGVSQDYIEAVRWFRKAAEQGNAWAQFNLGICYRDGHGVNQDYTEAARWYRKAAEQGNTRAQSYLGECYECGFGVNQDDIEAVRWYRKAAEQGSAMGQVNLGVFYYKGQGVGRDKAEAVRWWRKAAEQGSKDAILLLQTTGNEY